MIAPEAEEALLQQRLRGVEMFLEDPCQDCCGPTMWDLESQGLHVMQKRNKEYWIIITPCMSDSYKWHQHLFTGGYKVVETHRKPTLGLLCDLVRHYKPTNYSLGRLSTEQSEYLKTVWSSIQASEASA